MGVRGARQLALNESAAIAPLYAIGIFTLVAIAGVGFDYARMASLDSELQNAADQAALAGASQLDGEAANLVTGTTSSCARAANAVRTFIINDSRFADDGIASPITFQNETTCDATGSIRFWQDRNKATAATNDSNAKYIEVFVDPRATRYVLTPLVDAIGTPLMRAAAMAGLGSSICKQPPIMICSPDPTVPFNAESKKGVGILATGHSTGKNSNAAGEPGSDTTPSTHWSPGNFGFLEVQDASGATNKALLRALAYVNPPIDCISVEDNEVSTGSPQGLYDAINTRFGIYDFPSNNGGGGNVLASCEGSNQTLGNCPRAPNVRMDMEQLGSGNNSCKLNKSNGNGGKGYALPAEGTEFKPVDNGLGYNPEAAYNGNATLAKIGMPRDLCHYDSFNGTGLCSGGVGRVGDGKWARQDYFTKVHGSARPTNWKTITRYETYLWEIANSRAETTTCGSHTGDASRRVLTIAVVSNCDELKGGSRPVDIDEFVDTFLVEPSIDDNGTGEKNRRHTPFKDMIYLEVIGKSSIAGSGVFGSQEVRRDVPYLVE